MSNQYDVLGKAPGPEDLQIFFQDKLKLMEKKLPV